MQLIADKCKDSIKELAGAVMTCANPVSYGRTRSKLNKQGFSEIAIYMEIAQHCVDNEISPASFAKETLAYLEGCATNLYHPKTSNDFHFLRGRFHQIRHGDLEKGGVKSPEQKNMFLCNSCYEIKSIKLRSSNKNEKNTCNKCRSEKAKLRNNRKTKEPSPEETQSSPAQPVVISTNEKGFKHEDASHRLSAALLEIPEDINPTPSKDEEKNIPEPISTTKENEKVEPELKQVESESATTVDKENVEIKVTEVIADQENANVTIQLPTDNLHIVLSALKTLQK